MKKTLFALFLFTATTGAIAQHCPWDCSGMIQVEITAPMNMVYRMKPVLVDENKEVITDTIYGTGKETYDRCDFLYYDDFLKYRRNKIAIHSCYQYDTLYSFAKGKYIVRYNFCRYRDKKLFLRFTDPHKGNNNYHYIEIPGHNRIHLHDYDDQLRQNKTAAMVKATREFVLVIDCKTWGLQNNDCR
jgi:hypothetical protein